MPSAAASRKNGAKGGRPQGASGQLARITDRKARALAARDETPLDVMIDNMNFWRKRAAELSGEMERQLKKISDLDISDAKQQKVFIKAMQEFNKVAMHMIAAREYSQKCAVDAAPYVHPRFQSISVKHDSKQVKVVRLELTNPGGGALTFDATARKPEDTARESAVATVDGEFTELDGNGAGTGTDG